MGQYDLNIEIVFHDQHADCFVRNMIVVSVVFGKLTVPLIEISKEALDDLGKEMVQKIILADIDKYAIKN